MRKIAIVTIFSGNCNFGASLQAYALQKKAAELGADVRVLNIEFERIKEKRKITPERIKRKLDHIFHKIIYWDSVGKLNERCELFNQFKEECISTYKVKESELKNLADKFDVFVAGSDQIWNPNYWKPAYFLTFVSEEKKKAAYAASIGVSNYSDEEKKYVRKQLESFKAISVREKEGKKILDAMELPQDIQVVLDPTFLLKSVEWDNIVKKVDISYKYILCCFLGDDMECRKTAKNYAKQAGMKLVLLTTSYKELKLNHKIADLELIDIGPREFLYLVKNAEMVFTDSFHVMALSINYRKQFWVFERSDNLENNNMNSRIYSLLKILGLESRLINKDDIDRIDEELIPYETVEEKIKTEKEKSMLFLRKIVYD